MRIANGPRRFVTAVAIGFSLSSCWLLAGCSGAGSGLLNLLGSPFPLNVGSNGSTTGPGSTGTTQGGGGSSNTGTPDPCDETQTRKFIRISLRNQSPDYVHYFLILIANVNTTGAAGAGAVCPDDIGLYTSFGYTFVPEGSDRSFGNYCIVGPALFYFHRGGQFQSAGGQGLSSAIAPAQGSLPTFDTFFTNNGAQVPVPDLILFHNPGTTAEGRALRVAEFTGNPCSVIVVDTTTPDCELDSFYYVDDRDVRAGSTVLGNGSYVRVPSEIQGSGCSCGLGDDAFARLAPPGITAATAGCSQFLRGGKIEYAFIRNDTEPPIPQAVWRVSDASGQRVHDFDPRAGIR